MVTIDKGLRTLSGIDPGVVAAASAAAAIAVDQMIDLQSSIATYTGGLVATAELGIWQTYPFIFCRAGSTCFREREISLMFGRRITAGATASYPRDWKRLA